MIKVMLSLDLTNAKDNRPEFYSVLEGAGWKKAQNVDTVWLQDFSKYTSLDEQTLTNIRNDIARPLLDAYKNLKLDKIYYVAQIGNGAVISRVVEKRNGELKAYVENLF
jgi:hypothetical protein